jgi:very-short-patch-repair endonuclease
LVFWIENRNPDFVNVNGQKAIIEFDGDYWHNRFPDKDRLRDATYKKYGYKILSINYIDLKNEESLKKKIHEFESDKMKTNKIAGIMPEPKEGEVV